MSIPQQKTPEADMQEQLELLEKLRALKAERDLLRAEVAQLEAFQRECEIEAGHLRVLVNGSEDVGVYRLRTDLDNPYTARVVYVNKACERLLGVSFVNAFEQWFNNVHPEDREDVIVQQAMALQTGEYRTTLRLPQEDGETYRWIRQYAIAPRNEKGFREFFNGVAWDATTEIKARQDAEQQSKHLRRLSYELFQEEERQRKSIAEVLHDNIGQSLSLLRFNLAKEAKSAADDSELRECLEILDRAVGEIRNLTSGIYPTAMDQVGLVETLRWLCSQATKDLGVKVVFRAEGDIPDLDREAAIFLYRAAGELMFKYIKHCRSNNISLSLFEKDNGLCMRLVGDGEDLPNNTEAPTIEGGLGLFSIREKLTHLEGCLGVRTEPGRGADITVTIPI